QALDFANICATDEIANRHSVLRSQLRMHRPSERLFSNVVCTIDRHAQFRECGTAFFLCKR
ncbi:unnamed protein product, partial [Amoebophrya sp. A25]